MKMKQSTFKLAGVLLVLVLVTSCFVGSTFAKYTTSQWGQDAARVAKFGVTISTDGNMFNQEYATNDAGVSGTIANSVVSTSSDVIAPGTKGDLVSIALSGTPEVAVRVDYSANVLIDNWTAADGSYYCPLEIKIGDEAINGNAFESGEAFANEIKKKIELYSGTYAAGTDLGVKGTPSGSWSWSFEGDNAKDTQLGNKAATGTAATINLTVTTTVTQID